jgi:hypothetical protein
VEDFFFFFTPGELALTFSWPIPLMAHLKPYLIPSQLLHNIRLKKVQLFYQVLVLINTWLPFVGSSKQPLPGAFEFLSVRTMLNKFSLPTMSMWLYLLASEFVRPLASFGPLQHLRLAVFFNLLAEKVE